MDPSKKPTPATEARPAGQAGADTWPALPSTSEDKLAALSLDDDVVMDNASCGSGSRYDVLSDDDDDDDDAKPSYSYAVQAEAKKEAAAKEAAAKAAADAKAAAEKKEEDDLARMARQAKRDEAAAAYTAKQEAKMKKKEEKKAAAAAAESQADWNFLWSAQGRNRIAARDCSSQVGKVSPGECMHGPI